MDSGGAFVVGSGNKDWQRLNLASLEVTLFGDDVELLRSHNGASVADTIDALVWLANHAETRALLADLLDQVGHEA